MHIMGLVKKLFGDEPAAKTRSSNDYIDLSEYAAAERSGDGGASTHIRVAEIHRVEDLKEFSHYVYDGNVMILDFTPVAQDEIVLKRVTTELRKLSQDVGGDIAGLGDHMIILTPTGIKVDRRKLRVAT